MPRKPPDLTAAEFGLMKVLWELGAGTVADVRARILEESGGEPAYTTVMTLLGRMDKKGAVKVDRSREPFLYRPAFQKASARRERLKEFIRSVFDGRADELVLQLMEDESLSEDDLRRIEKKLEGSR